MNKKKNLYKLVGWPISISIYNHNTFNTPKATSMNIKKIISRNLLHLKRDDILGNQLLTLADTWKLQKKFLLAIRQLLRNFSRNIVWITWMLWV